jgi:hypothetical protein
MRAQLRLLEYLFHMWDVNKQYFHMGSHTLIIDIEDIYFLTGLSCCGSRVTLTGSRGGGEHMNHYISEHCVLGTQKHNVKVAIKDFRDLPLWAILYTITHMARSATPHMALQSYFQYALECMEPRVFNWCEGVLKSMKKQLTKCRSGGLKHLEYYSILISFFLERVPILRLQVEWGIPSPHDPRMKRWVNLMAQHAASPIVRYNDVFFYWLRTQMLMVDNYAYVGIEFRDLDLSLLEGSQWGDIGKNEFFFIMFLLFLMI